jgi:tRNA (guanine-N7-)-methyltransferase
MAKERTFPLEFEAQRPVYFHPAEPSEFAYDILEIGPGRGDLLLWCAANWPDKRLVGIELNGFRCRKLSRRIDKRGLTNVLLIKGNARIVVPRYFAAPTFERIYVLFPDPWPKERHAYQRLLSTEFLAVLADLLKPGGELVLATDWQPYADWVAANLAEIPQFINEGTPYVTGMGLLPNTEPTLFEQLWREEGREIFYLRARRQ